MKRIVFKSDTAQKIEFSIKDFFGKCDQIHRKLRIWSHLLNKSLIENFISVQCEILNCQEDGYDQSKNQIIYLTLSIQKKDCKRRGHNKLKPKYDLNGLYEFEQQNLMNPLSG